MTDSITSSIIKEGKEERMKRNAPYGIVAGSASLVALEYSGVDIPQNLAISSAIGIGVAYLAYKNIFFMKYRAKNFPYMHPELSGLEYINAMQNNFFELNYKIQGAIIGGSALIVALHRDMGLIKSVAVGAGAGAGGYYLTDKYLNQFRKFEH